MKAFAITSCQAAIATPVSAPSQNTHGQLETLTILSGGQALTINGQAALTALRQAVDHALSQTSGKGAPRLDGIEHNGFPEANQ